MRPAKLPWIAACAVFLAFPFLGNCAAAPPQLMLWSWYEPDDFRFLRDTEVGVAYCALSLFFKGQTTVTPHPRAVPVRISPATYQMAVIRLDYETGTAENRLVPTEQQRFLVVTMIAEIAALSRAPAIQIDFDAPASAHAFYRQLLIDLRSRLGPQIFLSMTALVSWCGTRESWLSGLPVDEIVPMAFDMGSSSAGTMTMLQRGSSFPYPGCQRSVGVQSPTGDGIRPTRNQRAYFFPTSETWSPASIDRARKIVLP